MLADQGAHVGDGARGHDPGRACWLGLEGGGHGLDGGDGRYLAQGLGEELSAVETRLAVDVCGGVEGWALEGLV